SPLPIAGHSVGRNAYLEEEVIGPIAELFDDGNDVVRKFAHQAIEMVAEVSSGAQGVVDANLVPTLVAKLNDETDEIKSSILDTLHFCLHVNTEDALLSGGMEVFNSLLSHHSPLIRAKAARDIMDLSVPLDGKKKAHEVGSMKRLIELMGDEDADVRANCAAAIMLYALSIFLFNSINIYKIIKVN
ncbi:radial spoke head 14 homolog, partial [Convolutriloba macropyga]|uniref:radial spoke head 14 homolog n=1 Tax=Convolutriloba macropyga TaxID=536237 RepID=UPI003F51F26D